MARSAEDKVPVTSLPEPSLTEIGEEASGRVRPSERRSGIVVTSLAELPARTLLDERALAEALAVTKRTVRRMVGRYELPPPVSFGGRSMWQVERVLSWFEDRAERLARDAQRVARKVVE